MSKDRIRINYDYSPGFRVFHPDAFEATALGNKSLQFTLMSEHAGLPVWEERGPDGAVIGQERSADVVREVECKFIISADNARLLSGWINEMLGDGSAQPSASAPLASQPVSPSPSHTGSPPPAAEPTTSADVKPQRAAHGSVRSSLLDLVNAHPNGIKVSDIVAKTGFNSDTVRVSLSTMRKAGKIGGTGDGMYYPARKEQEDEQPPAQPAAVANGGADHPMAEPPPPPPASDLTYVPDDEHQPSTVE